MTTKRYVGSLLIGVLVGLSFGVFLGWGPMQVEYKNSSLAALAPRHQEEYTVMVAEGYQYDRDINSVLARLQPLGKDNTINYVKELTERYISQSNVPAIAPLVALVEALVGSENLPPVMELYRSTLVPTPSSQGSQ